jgi:hypothetical protein
MMGVQCAGDSVVLQTGAPAVSWLRTGAPPATRFDPRYRQFRINRPCRTWREIFPAALSPVSTVFISLDSAQSFGSILSAQPLYALIGLYRYRPLDKFIDQALAQCRFDLYPVLDILTAAEDFHQLLVYFAARSELVELFEAHQLIEDILVDWRRACFTPWAGEPAEGVE